MSSDVTVRVGCHGYGCCHSEHASLTVVRVDCYVDTDLRGPHCCYIPLLAKSQRQVLFKVSSVFTHVNIRYFITMTVSILLVYTCVERA